MGNEKEVSNQSQSGFFAIEKSAFHSICGLGMNPAVAYLVICCGTGRSNQKSKWSVNAIEKYTSISRGRAKKAVQMLIDKGYISLAQSSTQKHPLYEVREGKSRGKLDPQSVIWLPNGIIQSVAGEVPALERIRQTQEVMILRLFVDLYSSQNLLDDSGIAREVYQTTYERRKIAEFSIYDIYCFDRDVSNTHFNGITELHYEDNLIFERMGILESLGLIQEVPHLLDSMNFDGEVIHAVDDDINSASRNAALTMLEHFKSDSEVFEADEADYLIPIPKHTPNASIIGIYQLRYKPRTKITASWYKEHAKRLKRALSAYQSMEIEAENVIKTAIF